MKQALLAPLGLGMRSSAQIAAAGKILAYLILNAFDIADGWQHVRIPAAPEWNYNDNGASWYTIGQCGNGLQSPINVSGVYAPADGNVKLFYRFSRTEAPVPMTNDGQVLEATIENENPGVIGVGEFYPSRLTSSYRLRRIKVHTPSEHTFGGKQMPLELQLIHQGGPDAEATGNEIAVVSIGFYFSSDPDVKSLFLDSLRQGGLPNKAGAETLVNRESPAVLDFGELFGPDGKIGNNQKAAFWQYYGSLTVPPCTTGVRWFVRANALPASADAINEFAAAIHAVTSASQEHAGNNRALQPPEGRKIDALFAEDATQDKEAPKVDDLFAAAVAEAKAAQKRADKALRAEKVVKPDSVEAQVEEAAHYHGFSPEESGAATEVDISSDETSVCFKNLANTREEIAAAEGRKKAECDGAETARTNLEAMQNSGAANAAQALQAIMAHRTQSSICTSETENLEALQAQAEHQKAECDQMEAETATESSI